MAATFNNNIITTNTVGGQMDGDRLEGNFDRGPKYIYISLISRE